MPLGVFVNFILFIESNPISNWWSDWAMLGVLTTIAVLLFAIYRNRQSRKTIKPQLTLFRLINEEHFVAKIVSGFDAPIPHPKFFISKLRFGFIPFPKLVANSKLIEDNQEIEKLDEYIPRISFKGEQLFWIILPETLELSKGKYKIYVKTSVGACSTIYTQKDDSLLKRLSELIQKDSLKEEKYMQ